MRSSLISAGTMEILRYVPPVLLQKEVAEMDMDEFFDALALARYAQELERDIMLRAIYEAFGEK